MAGTRPDRKARAAIPQALSRFSELLASFLRAGPAGPCGSRRSAPDERCKITFEKVGFRLAPPNDLNPYGIALVELTIRNGSSVQISEMEILTELFLDGQPSPAASGVIRAKFERTDGLHAGATHSAVAAMRTLSSDDWVAARVWEARSREVRLRVQDVYDMAGQRLEP